MFHGWLIIFLATAVSTWLRKYFADDLPDKSELKDILGGRLPSCSLLKLDTALVEETSWARRKKSKYGK